MKASSLQRDLHRAIDRFSGVSLPSLLRQAGRAAWLHLPRGVTPPSTPEQRAERVVVSLSTVPARANLIGAALRSLLDQEEPADGIVLALPERSRREGIPYPDPQTLRLPAGVEVLRCEDEGPATKFLAALRAEPDAVLVVVDDDVVYPRSFLRELLAAHRRRPGAALGLRGVNREAGKRFADFRHVFGSGIVADVPVDILFGTWGYLLPPGIASAIPKGIGSSDEALRWVDDIWLSAQLARAGVDRYVVPVKGLPIETIAALRASLSGGVNRTGRNEEAALEALADSWNQERMRPAERAG